MLRECSSLLEELGRILDLLLLAAAFYFTVNLYQTKEAGNYDFSPSYLLFIVCLISWVIAANFNRVYQSRRFMSFWREIRLMGQAHLMSLAICLLFITLYDPHLIRNRFLFYFTAYAVVLTAGAHIFTRLILETWRVKGKNIRYILIMGSGPASQMYLDKIRENPQLGYKVIGYLAPGRNGLTMPYLGDYSRIEQVIKSQVIDLVVITEALNHEGIRTSLELLDTVGKTVAFVLDDAAIRIHKSRPVDFGGLPMVAYDAYPRHPAHELAKRFIDIIVSSVGLIILGPVLLILALAVKITSRGPVVFAQDRIGFNGRVFKMYKFRSMVTNAEELKEQLSHLNEMSGPVFKIKNDPRVTAVGRFIRRTSLDELPQLLNVLKGDMSLVGPRPPLPGEVKTYDCKYRKRLAVKPGITCTWQISGRNEVNFEKWMEMDADYVDHWSLWLDMEILVKTLPAVLLKRGAS